MSEQESDEQEGGEQGEGPAVIAQGAIDTLRELRELLRKRDIHSEMIQPPEGQGSS